MLRLFLSPQGCFLVRWNSSKVIRLPASHQHDLLSSPLVGVPECEDIYCQHAVELGQLVGHQ